MNHLENLKKSCKLALEAIPKEYKAKLTIEQFIDLVEIAHKAEDILDQEELTFIYGFYEGFIYSNT